MVVKTDLQAKIKLLGAALRLERFSINELVAFTSVNRATAKAFVRREMRKKGSWVQSSAGFHPREQISGGNVAFDLARGDTPKPKVGKGRPEKVYELVSAGTGPLIETLSKFRNALDHASKATLNPLPEDQQLTPIDLFEAAVTALAGENTQNDRRKAAIEEARIFQAGAQAHLEGLSRSPHAQSLLDEMQLRFDHARQRMVAIQDGSSLAVSGDEIIATEIRVIDDHVAPRRSPSGATNASASPAQRFRSLCDSFVAKFGEWVIPPGDELLEPVVILLDGVKGDDPLSRKVINACKTRQLPAVVVDLDRIHKADRAALFGALDRLRATTPLATADVILTLDGGTPHAKRLAHEVKDLAVIGTWERKVRRRDGVSDVSAQADDDSLRAFFAREAMNCLNQGIGANRSGAEAVRDKVNASRVTSALSALAALRVADVASKHRSRSRQIASGPPVAGESELRKAVPELMGGVYCLDISHNASIERDLSNASVQYVPKAEIQPASPGEPLVFSVPSLRPFGQSQSP